MDSENDYDRLCVKQSTLAKQDAAFVLEIDCMILKA